jgi:hypothetical protein
MSFEKKYLKYKKKYVDLQNTIIQTGASTLRSNAPVYTPIRFKSMIDGIKGKVIGWYNTKNLNEINNSCYEQLNGPWSYEISSVKFPIYYLFDQLLDTDIGSYKVDYYIYNFNLEELFSINTENLHILNINKHVTIFYKFEFNNRKYIYYSNSGLGINNQLYNNHTTACKIFYINDINDTNIWNNLSIHIHNIINAVISITHWSDLVMWKGKIRLDEIWAELQPKIVEISRNFTKEDYIKLVNFNMKEDKLKNKHITMCYILLNFFCKKYKSEMSECTINHVLYGYDKQKYKDIISQLIDKTDINDYINNCYNDYNSSIYQEIINIPEESLERPFKTFIKDVNDKLDELKYLPEYPTLKYKLDNSFKLIYNNISGLYNNEQQAGSCSFYSIYNLALNMKILNAFNDNQNVNAVIESFIEFHYMMIYLFCLSNDTKYTPKQYNKYNLYNLFDIQFINRVIKDNNLLDEILHFYPSETFLLNPNRLFIDKLLDYEMNGRLEKLPIMKQITNNVNIFNDLYNYINKVIYDIRNKINIDIVNICSQIKTLFTEIISNINSHSTNNIYNYTFDTKQIFREPYQIHNFIEIYFNTIAEIHIIYLICLFEIYQGKIYQNEIKSSNIIFSYLSLVFNIPNVYYSDEKTWNTVNNKVYTWDYINNKEKSKEDNSLHYFKFPGSIFISNIFLINQLQKIEKIQMKKKKKK